MKFNSSFKGLILTGCDICEGGKENAEGFHMLKVCMFIYFSTL